MRAAGPLAGAALALCACNGEAPPGRDLPPECRSRPAPPPPPEDDVVPEELDPSWALSLRHPPTPDCAGTVEGVERAWVRWTDDSGVSEEAAEGTSRTRFLASGDRCRISSTVDLDAALPPGRGELRLCDAYLTHREWASFDELDFQLAGFGVADGTTMWLLPVRRSLRVKPRELPACGEDALRVELEDLGALRFRVDIDVPLEDWRRAQAWSGPSVVAWLQLDLR